MSADGSNTSSESGAPEPSGWEFPDLAAEIRAVGESHPGSTFLRARARSARVLCRVHGVLTPADGQEGMRGRASDWAELGELARDHVADSADGGCEVAVERWTGAVYAPGFQSASAPSEATASSRAGAMRTVRVEFLLRVPERVDDARVRTSVENAFRDRADLLGWERSAVGVRGTEEL